MADETQNTNGSVSYIKYVDDINNPTTQEVFNIEDAGAVNRLKAFVEGKLSEWLDNKEFASGEDLDDVKDYIGYEKDESIENPLSLNSKITSLNKEVFNQTLPTDSNSRIDILEKNIDNIVKALYKQACIKIDIDDMVEASNKEQAEYQIDYPKYKSENEIFEELEERFEQLSSRYFIKTNSDSSESINYNLSYLSSSSEISIKNSVGYFKEFYIDANRTNASFISNSKGAYVSNGTIIYIPINRGGKLKLKITDGKNESFEFIGNTSNISFTNNDYYEATFDEDNLYIQNGTHFARIKCYGACYITEIIYEYSESYSLSVNKNKIVASKPIECPSINIKNIQNIFNEIHPVGELYYQLNTKKSPSDLYGDYSTWTKIKVTSDDITIWERTK